MSDRTYVLTEFKNRRVPIGTRHEMTWPEIVERFRSPEITYETITEYQAMSNEQRTDVKDVGGYVAGEFTANRRSKAALQNRQIVTIDVDHAGPELVGWVSKEFSPVHLIHSTHSSTPDQLRVRILVPLTRPVNADEYRYIANQLCKEIGADAVDDSTDQPERLMFWPSVSFDQDYTFVVGGTEVLDPDAILPEDLPISAPVKPERKVEDGEIVIPEGQRNRTVFSFASNLRNNGLDKGGIRAMLDEYNERYCNPPLASFELDTITNSVLKYPPGELVGNALRTAFHDFSDMGEWKDEPRRGDGELPKAISLKELGTLPLKPPTFLVDDLITSGLTLMVSPPKFGKSWMCMDLAISVASGTDFLGFKTKQAGVIYYALEDSDYRLQDRGKKVAGTRELPGNLYLLKTAPTLDNGLLDELHTRLKEHPDVGLIIIDTLQRVRGAAHRTEGAYGFDYRELGGIQRFALDHNISVLVVHHTNKSQADNDVMNAISGTNGVLGAADATLLLTKQKRGDRETLMHTTGRDIGYHTFVITMDMGRYRWVMLGEERDADERREEREFRDDPLVQTIVRHLDEAQDLLDEDATEVSWSCTTAQLLEEMTRLYGDCHISANALGMKLSKIDEKLMMWSGVAHTSVREGKSGSRKHIFTREII